MGNNRKRCRKNFLLS